MTSAPKAHRARRAADGTDTGGLGPVGLFPHPSPTPGRLAALRLCLPGRRARPADPEPGIGRDGLRKPSPLDFPSVAQFVLFVGTAALLGRSTQLVTGSAWEPAVPDLGGLLCATIVFAMLTGAASVLEAGRWTRWARRAGGFRKAAVDIAACAVLAIICTTVAILAMALSSLVLPRLPATPREQSLNFVRALPDGSGVILWTRIMTGTTDRLREVLDANPRARTLYLVSHGGLGEEGISLGDLVRERGLDTVAFGDCASACTFAFAGGRRRLAHGGSNGRLGYHPGWRHPVPFTGETGLQVAGRAESMAFYRRYGLAQPFVERAESGSPEDMWWPDSGELYAGNVIDGVLDPYALPGYAFLFPPSELPAPFAAGWAPATLSRHAPAAVDEIRAWTRRTDARARNAHLKFEARQRAVARLLSGALAAAPDAEVRKAGAYLADAMAVARLKSHADCARMGAFADFQAAEETDPHPAGSASDPDDPYGALFGRALSAAAAYGWRPGDLRLRDPDDGALWTPAAHAAPRQSCNALVDWYRAASDIDDLDGPSRLRSLFARVAAARDGDSAFDPIPAPAAPGPGTARTAQATRPTGPTP